MASNSAHLSKLVQSTLLAELKTHLKEFFFPFPIDTKGGKYLIYWDLTSVVSADPANSIDVTSASGASNMAWRSFPSTLVHSPIHNLIHEPQTCLRDHRSPSRLPRSTRQFPTPSKPTLQHLSKRSERSCQHGRHRESTSKLLPR